MMNKSEMALDIQNVSHWFGEDDAPFDWATKIPTFARNLLPETWTEGTKRNKVLNKINLQISPGQIVGLVGPSGCGKSTLLRAILGTHPSRQGEINSGGHRIESPTRDVGIVYQHYGLYPFLTAQQNVAFGLMLDETTLFDRTKLWKWLPLRRVHLHKSLGWLEKLGLGEAINKYPSEMSGGMRQRVAIAQALIMAPRILLLDEPFGALDEATREDLQLMLLRLYAENEEAMEKGEDPPYTILIVTHELNEALYVSDRVIGLSQFHSDGENGATIVYDRPAPVFRPTDVRDFEMLVKQREELRQHVFDPENLQDHNEFITFWEDHSKTEIL